MRVILKPAGLMFVLSAFLVLIVSALWRYRNSSIPPASLAVSATSAVASLSKTPAATKAGLPSDILLMPDIASSEWLTFITPAIPGDSAVAAVIEIVNAAVPGHPRARHIDVSAVNGKPWHIQIARPLSVPLKKGKRIRLTFWGRSQDSCPVTAAVEQNAAPYTKIVYQVETLTPEWKQYTEEWIQPSDTPDNWAKMDFQLGHKVGAIEITGVIIRQVEGNR